MTLCFLVVSMFALAQAAIALGAGSAGTARPDSAALVSAEEPAGTTHHDAPAKHPDTKSSRSDEKPAHAGAKAAASGPLSAVHGQFTEGSWPFRPLARPSTPQPTRLGDWCQNDVDRFIAGKLEEAGLQPNPPADKLTLLRRVTFDLTGLPPTPSEQKAFLADHTRGAYAKVVDRLLDSPRYGERWAQHWLDVVRYSETEGFKRDALRPNAYRYRDYVIRAMNDDMPYDRFVREQLAGDEIAPDNPEALVATGLIRLYPDEYNASNLVQRRQEILDDVTDNTSIALLGMTVGCARCHDHKFDDIKQADYYRMQACFAAILPRDDASLADKAQSAQYKHQVAKWEAATKPIREKIDKELADERHDAMQDAISAYDPLTLAAINTPVEKRTCLQKQLVAEAEQWVDSRLARAYRRCKPDERKLYDEQIEELAKFDSMKPEPLPTAMAVMDGGLPAPPTFVLGGGDYKNPKQEVTPGFPAFLGASEPELATPESEPDSTGRRSALAAWLTRPDHPLTARVIVNRLWQHHFGQGIVATANDFGAMGSGATHEELLDWLACELVADGWHLKPMHRLMVMSATYCQSAAVDPKSAVHVAALAKDAADNLLWHARRQRLEGDALRDSVLQVSGQLNLRMYGPSARPALSLSPDIISRYTWDPDEKEADRNRRSIYVLAKRNLRLPLLEAFDQPDMHGSCPRRSNTTTPTQALELLNGDLVDSAARKWSGKLIAETGADEGKLVREAYEEAYSRPPETEEVGAAEQFIDQDASKIADEATQPPESELPEPLPLACDRAKSAAIVDFCRAVLCTNEFMYVD